MTEIIAYSVAMRDKKGYTVDLKEPIEADKEKRKFWIELWKATESKINGCEVDIKIWKRETNQIKSIL